MYRLSVRLSGKQKGDYWLVNLLNIHFLHFNYQFFCLAGKMYGQWRHEQLLFNCFQPVFFFFFQKLQHALKCVLFIWVQLPFLLSNCFVEFTYLFLPPSKSSQFCFLLSKSTSLFFCHCVNPCHVKSFKHKIFTDHHHVVLPSQHGSLSAVVLHLVLFFVDTVHLAWLGPVYFLYVAHSSSSLSTSCSFFFFLLLFMLNLTLACQPRISNYQSGHRLCFLLNGLNKRHMKGETVSLIRDIKKILYNVEKNVCYG